MNIHNRNIMIKVCGIRSPLEVDELKTLPIDYLGMIFASGVRHVSVEDGVRISSAVKSAGKKSVGVFVNETQANILAIDKEVNLDVLQLHGDESCDFCRSLYNKTSKKIWKAFAIRNTLPSFEDYLPSIEFPLFDAKGLYAGGNGIAFDWKLLRKVKRDYILAGGLNETNIQNALAYNPTVIDLNSGVESGNRKDKDKVENIIRILSRRT